VTSVTDAYRADPCFCAWALARVANANRAADMTKANHILDLARKTVATPPTGDNGSLPERSVLSYIERNLGVNLAMLGEWTKATGHFTTAIRLLPTNATAQYLRGVAFQEEGEFAKAAALHLRAIVLDPDFRSPCMALGTCWASIGRYQEAVDACLACLHRQPDAPLAQYTMGQAIYQLLREDWQLPAGEAAALRKRGLEAFAVAKAAVPKGQQWLSSDEEKVRFLQAEAGQAYRMPRQPLSLWKQPPGWRPQ